MRNIRTLTAAAIIVCTMFAAAQQQPDINNELTRLRKELTQIQVQRDKNRVERDNEKKDFEAYRDRMTKRMNRARADIDSVKQEAIVRQHASDSLAAQVTNLQQRKHQVDLSKESLRLRLAASCDVLDSIAISLPPLVLGQVRSSIALVKSELAAKSIESAEAFGRLSQTAILMREAMSSVQAGQETSPVADLRGTVCRIRIGCLLEAVADLKGEKCFVWQGNTPDGAPVWKAPVDPGMAANVVTATAVREGKHLPVFVSLPLAIAGKGAER
jgi:hypothetical protein